MLDKNWISKCEFWIMQTNKFFSHPWNCLAGKSSTVAHMKRARRKGNRAVAAPLLPERALSLSLAGAFPEFGVVSHMWKYFQIGRQVFLLMSAAGLCTLPEPCYLFAAAAESISFRSERRERGENWSEAANHCRLGGNDETEPAAQRDIWNRFNDLSREISVRVALTLNDESIRLLRVFLFAASFAPCASLLGRKAHSNSDLLILSPSI